jgi:hypothetical protein
MFCRSIDIFPEQDWAIPASGSSNLHKVGTAQEGVLAQFEFRSSLS